jgi:hypothetical protein
MLATGLLQQQMAAEGGSAPSTPRSSRYMPSYLPSSLAPSSLAPSVNGDLEG